MPAPRPLAIAFPRDMNGYRLVPAGCLKQPNEGEDVLNLLHHHAPHMHAIVLAIKCALNLVAIFTIAALPVQLSAATYCASLQPATWCPVLSARWRQAATFHACWGSHRFAEATITNIARPPPGHMRDVRAQTDAGVLTSVCDGPSTVVLPINFGRCPPIQPCLTAASLPRCSGSQRPCRQSCQTSSSGCTSGLPSSAP